MRIPLRIRAEFLNWSQWEAEKPHQISLQNYFDAGNTDADQKSKKKITASLPPCGNILQVKLKVECFIESKSEPFYRVTD